MRRFFNRGATDSPATSSPEPLPSYPYTATPPVQLGHPRPIRLVYCDENGKFKMDPEAVAVLQLLKEPVGVVSVCGRARQGKSFILNQLLGQSSGFQVASTHRPCTKGLWLWSTPIRRTALDGTVYNLLLIDSEGIDAYDQTGTYSTQIFSLAVLLSSMFIYNQMGGIDEAALDRLSLVTEMSKRIRVRASGEKSTASEIGQFSPIFVWLLRDFYLDLVEDNRRITPRDYLEIALRPVQGNKRDVAAKNEIRESIRALFPDRECFPLVRPLSNENDLQRLDQISVNNLRPEFRSGLDALTKFIFERTRPKQVGGTVMTGPIFARITQSYLDALNKGVVPTITSSWQSVEEAECQRAYDLAAEVYMSTFDRSKPPEEALLREAHEEAVRKSMAAYDATAVGSGSTRQKHEMRLQQFLKKAFEDYKKDAFREAYLQCSNAIQSMEKELRTACNAPDAKVEKVIKVLEGLLSKYEASSHGPEKWQKWTIFLQQSLEGPVLDLIKKQMDRIGSEKSSIMLKCRSIEDKMGLLNKQLEASEKFKSEYLQRYEDARNDKKKISDDYMSRISNLQSKCSSLEERCSSLSKAVDLARQDGMEWKRKYENLLLKQKAEEDQASSELAILRSRSSAAEARLAAAQEQSKSAQDEAGEWKRTYDIAVREAKHALEKAAAVQERSNKQTQLREDALRDEFSVVLADKEEELKDKAAKIERAEQRVTTLSLEMKAAESKIKSYDMEIAKLKCEIRDLSEKLESLNATAQTFEKEAPIKEQEKVYLEVLNEYSEKIQAVAAKLATRESDTEIAKEPIVETSTRERSPKNDGKHILDSQGLRRRSGIPSSVKEITYESVVTDQSAPVKLDTAAQSHIAKHRKLQEDLTDEMVVLARQLKESSQMMSHSLKNTEKILDSTEKAVEHSLGSTRHASTRAMEVYSHSFETTCFTWLMIFAMTCIFIMVVLLIRVTQC